MFSKTLSTGSTKRLPCPLRPEPSAMVPRDLRGALQGADGSRLPVETRDSLQIPSTVLLEVIARQG